jgi:hypothetical protein
MFFYTVLLKNHGQLRVYNKWYICMMSFIFIYLVKRVLHDWNLESNKRVVDA